MLTQWVWILVVACSQPRDASPNTPSRWCAASPGRRGLCTLPAAPAYRPPSSPLFQRHSKTNSRIHESKRNRARNRQTKATDTKMESLDTSCKYLHVSTHCVLYCAFQCYILRCVLFSCRLFLGGGIDVLGLRRVSNASRYNNEQQPPTSYSNSKQHSSSIVTVVATMSDDDTGCSRDDKGSIAVSPALEIQLGFVLPIENTADLLIASSNWEEWDGGKAGGRPVSEMAS